MILKRIEIYGFKSFGRKCEIDFNEPITGIVGPNGSGKSNIVDAVRWVLGEQRVKSLRGSKMEDVIFSGTEEKKALGYAQVVLYLDNSDKRFPIDYEEISVARRLFRSGESEYYLNKNICRLKDIHELFMDTGLGREGYSIIGQGQIESIVNASSVERKLLIEEAVGIVKYKTRKIEAERKLEKAQNNLYRITDILAELEGRLPSLKRQSDKAEKFLQYRNELKGIEINIFVHRMERFNEQLSKAAKDKAAIEESLRQIDDEIRTLDDRYNSLKNLVGSQDTQITQVNEQIYELMKNFENSKTEISVSKSKIESYETSMFDSNREIGTIKQEIEQLLQTQEQTLNTLASARLELESAKIEYDTKMTFSQELEQKYKSSDLSISNIKEQIGVLEQKILFAQNEKNELISTIKNQEYLIEQWKSDISETKNNRENAKTIIAENRDDLKDLQNAQTRLNDLRSKQNELSESYDAYKEKVSALYTKLQTEESKLQLLVGYENSMQGYRFAIKKLKQYQMNDATLCNQIHGTVGDLIQTDQQYTEAITKALGGAIDNMVVEDERVAKESIRILKENRWGRITFLPLNIIRRSNKIEDNYLSSHPGFVACASDLVTCDQKFRPIIENLLARVIVVDHIDHATEIAKQTSYRYKLVTLDGEVLFPGGAMVGGKGKEQDDGILQRKGQIDQLEQSVKAGKAEYDDLLAKKDDFVEQAKRNHEEIQQAQKEYDELKEINVEQLQLIKNANQMIKQADELIAQREMQIIDSERLMTQNSEKENQIDESIQILQKTIEEMRNDLTKSSSGGYKEDYMQAMSNKNDAEIALIKAQEAIVQWEDRLDNLDEKIQNLNEQKRLRESAIEHWQEEIATLRMRIADCTQIDHDYDLARKELDELHHRLIEEKKSSNEEYINVNDRIISLNKDRNVITEQLNKLDVQIGKVELETEHLQAGIMEDYGLTYASALEFKTEIENLNHSIQVVSDLKEQIRKLGNINVEALEEYKEVKARFEEMSGQKEDLEQAKEELISIIKDISASMVHQFMQQFSIIQREFNNVFVKMFNGGEAHLVLTDPDNVMESGIDIIAQPPKTKLKNIAALSGGEKSMTAVSLIFAIFKIKPSPFCILDEIDAALDDANAMRFCEYLISIKANNQFIIITHKKQTMEIADVLYGASMAKDGITQMFSVKMSQIDDKGEVNAG